MTFSDPADAAQPPAPRRKCWTMPRGSARPIIAVCLLLVLFATLSFTAVLSKSATYDEPLHLVGGEVHRYLHDYRINPEDPALFGFWASLPHTRSTIPLDAHDAFYEGAPNDMNQQWLFVISALYGHGGTNAHHILDVSRAMFVLLGVALGLLISVWAWQIAGPVAAVAAAALFCLDPNMLAHSALVKNDVPLSLLMCLLGYALWRAGRSPGRATGFALLAALSCGLALNVKFSGVLFFAMFGVLLMIRALMPAPWRLIWRTGSREQRVFAAVAATILNLLLAWAITWGVYGFRYSATADGIPMNSAAIVKRSISNRIKGEIENHRIADMSQPDLDNMVASTLKDGQLSLPVQVDLWMQAHHILPEGWLFGFLFTYATTLLRAAFLMGSIRVTGWWYYFPMAMLFKTPTATIVAAALAPFAILFIVLTERRRRNEAAWNSAGKAHGSEAGDSEARGGEGGGGAAGGHEAGGEADYETHPQDADGDEEGRAARWLAAPWTIIALSIPPAIYLAVAMSTNLNLGLRHILPVYPFLFIALAWVFARLIRLHRLLATLAGCVILLGLATETLAAYPDYLAFFNVASGGSRGGLHLLGDSNLDWGQDLLAVQRWQRLNPDVPLYLCYFGMADPASYDLRFTNLLGGYPLLPMTGQLTTPGVIAMSATNLQGIYLSPDLRKSYQQALKGEEPFKVLNGTIYLYNWPPR